MTEYTKVEVWYKSSAQRISGPILVTETTNSNHLCTINSDTPFLYNNWRQKKYWHLIHNQDSQ
jgi:hypothetical protein